MAEINQTNSNAGRGGARKGAGRKPGSATKKTREIAEKALAEGLTPLEYMLQIMRTPPKPGLKGSAWVSAVMLRFEAAKAAAPYMHPRLAAVEHSGKVTIRSLAEELAELNGTHGHAAGDPPVA